MAKLGLIGGHSILGAEPGEGFRRVRAEGERGAAELFEDRSRDVVLMQRHGLDGYRTAAAIDHPRNLSAIAATGCERILALASVGSLRADLAVGSFVLPDDFIALHLGLSLGDGHGGERVPGFDAAWREELRGAWGRAAEPELVDGGVYWQAIGPRFETPAEIRLIAAHADLVGMTIASECVIAGEIGIPYAAVCVVDNLANGIADRQLTVEEFESGKAANRERLVAAVDAVVAELA